MCWVSIAALAVCFLVAGSAWACPNCKEAFEQGAAAGAFQVYKLLKGMNASILFMLSMPFLLAGAFAGFLVRASRR